MTQMLTQGNPVPEQGKLAPGAGQGKRERFPLSLRAGKCDSDG